MKTQRSNIKLLTYTSYDERKMIMEYWIKERNRLIRRGTHILSDLYRYLNCTLGIASYQIQEIDSVRIEMIEVRDQIFKLEYRERQYQEGINPDLIGAHYESFLL